MPWIFHPPPSQQLNSMDYIMISALSVYSFDSIKISTICRNILFLHNHFNQDIPINAIILKQMLTANLDTVHIVFCRTATANIF